MAIRQELRPPRRNASCVKRLCCLFTLGASTTLSAQNIPQELLGKWIIQRELSTRTISCWGEKEARAIIGTEIEYTPDSFRWKKIVVQHPSAEVAIVSARQFEKDNSSPSANGSQVSFHQLGIITQEVKQVTIDHSPAKLTGATTEIPGDVVLLKSRNAIVFSVCNLYFEAKRAVSAP